MRLEDNVFVVTGGGNGIGREVVLGLLERDARVAAVDLSEGSLDETARRAGQGADRLSLHTVNLTDRVAMEGLPADVVSRHGHVDGIVHVAGIVQQFAALMELSYEQIDKVFTVNLWGTIHLAKSFVPHLIARPEACLVNVASMGGLVPVPGQTVYGSSKAAIHLLTEGLRAELRDTPVAVTTVVPGGVATEITTNSGVAAPAQTNERSAQLLTSPAKAARHIINGIEHGRFRVVVGKDARLVDLLARIMPTQAIKLVAKAAASVTQR